MTISRGLRHIALLTRDLDGTERFYTAMLGLEVAFRVPPNMLFLRSPGCSDLLNFVRTRKKFAATQPLDHFGFKMTSRGLKRLEKQLKANRIKIESRRSEDAIYFRDPNGYRIEVYCD